MIWIASFPRSGNTFIRNILSEVYGIESSTYHQEGYPLDENYQEYTFVKTHLLPEQLPFGPKVPSVYLLRDGRDALISLAHHRSEIIAPGTDLMVNLKEGIIAAEGSYFGGWSINVESWLKRADIIIRFEDLVNDPIGQVERIRSIYPELPQPDRDKLPTFQSQKFGAPRYGSGSKFEPDNQEKAKKITENWFRKGKINGWKDEFSEPLHRLFWSYHRLTMERVGYTYSGEPGQPNPEINFDVLEKTGKQSLKHFDKKRILIEANKLLMHHNDGIKRYVSELLKAMYPISLNPNSKWKIDLYLDGEIKPLAECGDLLFDVNKNENRKLESRSKFHSIIRLGKELSKIALPESAYEKIAIIVKRSLLKWRKSKGKDAITKVNKIDLGNQTSPYDLIHIPLIQHYESFSSIEGRFVITLHDLTHRLFPQFHTKSNVELAEQGLRFFIDKKADVITISESTRRSMHEVEGMDPLKAINIPEAADPKKFKPLFNKHFAAIVKKLYNIPVETPFILTLSTLEPRKNLIETVKAFEILLNENPDLDVRLVIAGPAGWKNKGLKLVRNRKNIIFTGFINEEHLPVLYNEAAALCYVSKYEGFGLPVLEAMSCGTPVIFGNNSSMKEYFTGYGLPAEADDIKSISDQMLRIFTDKSTRENYSSKALLRSFDFSWPKTAVDTLKAYEDFIKSKS